MYLELRHLITHNGSRADQEFVNKYGNRMRLAVGDRLPLQARTVQSAVDAVTVLVKDIDTQLLAGGIVTER